MLERSTIVIDQNKGNEFAEFIAKNAKNKQFWSEVQKSASVSVDKEIIDGLFSTEK